MFDQRISFRLCAGALLLAAAAVSHAAVGNVVFVDDDAPAGGDGMTWDTAYRFLQDGLTDASGGGISEIRVAQGTYKPDEDEANPDGTSDREATFRLINNVSLMGGYAGIGADDPNARDIELYETILSGDLLGNDGENFKNNDENCYHVVYAIETELTAVLNGVFITAGNANFPEFNNDRFGGGMLVVDGDPTVISCTFVKNASRTGGGGLANIYGGPEVSHCLFLENGQTRAGGGVYDDDGSAQYFDCEFIDNHADGPPAIGGGGVFTSDSQSTFLGCRFTSNATDKHGGGMYNESGSAQVVDCWFENNDASHVGGGLINNNNTALIQNCAFIANSAGVGGGIANDLDQVAPRVVNCLFVGNTTVVGGAGLWAVSTFGLDLPMEVTNCTFTDNTAGGSGGGGMLIDLFSPPVTNCIFWNNLPNQIADFANTPTVTYCDVQGGWEGEGNIDADPLFIDPENGDYRLSPDSLVIDAADNTAVPKGIETDLDSNLRFVQDPMTRNTGLGDCPIVDMGSYEFQEGVLDCCPWDLIETGNISEFDLLLLLASWGPCRGCPADFDGDGSVGLSDLLALLANWGPCP